MKKFLVLLVFATITAVVITGCGGGGGGGGSTVGTGSGVGITIDNATNTAYTRLSSDQSQTYTATITGSTNTAVTWSVDGNGANGSINATTGVYTSPSLSSGSIVANITATSVADPTKTATIQVTVSFSPPGPPF